MSDETPGGHVPLPPEKPPPEPELTAADDAVDPGMPKADAGSGEPAQIPADPVDGSASNAAADGEGANSQTSNSDWWRGDDVRQELRDDWHDTSGEAVAAAREVGYQLEQAAGTISDAVAAQAYPAAKRQGLDIRWMRLSINIPAILLALLVTYGGRTTTDRMVETIAEDGPFAPLGWLLLAVMVLGVFMVLPIGAPLAQAVGNIVQWAAHGLIAAVRRGWHTPGIGYVLRLAVATFAWSFGFAVLYVGGRSIIHWLTGA
jgi:hypothetical protein